MSTDTVKRFNVVAKFSAGKFGWFGMARVYDGGKLKVTLQEYAPSWMDDVEGEIAKEQDRLSKMTADQIKAEKAKAKKALADEAKAKKDAAKMLES